MIFSTILDWKMQAPGFVNGTHGQLVPALFNLGKGLVEQLSSCRETPNLSSRFVAGGVTSSKLQLTLLHELQQETLAIPPTRGFAASPVKVPPTPFLRCQVPRGKQVAIVCQGHL